MDTNETITAEAGQDSNMNLVDGHIINSGGSGYCGGVVDMDFLIKALEELTVGMEKKGILHQEGMERGRTYLTTIPSWPSPSPPELEVSMWATCTEGAGAECSSTEQDLRPASTMDKVMEEGVPGVLKVFQE